MSARLSEQDIGDKDVFVALIDAYLDSKEVEPAAKKALVGILEQVVTAQQAGERPRWAEQIKAWQARQNK